ncbi:hydrogenase formation protein HypD [Candidatus Parcubacteria bacterium]|nr:hydrogenase formation protein HypD [Patescibacteria group bacterium]MBU4309714.1 hydrogenase formation protein HypD [Patescibacteria group bacterium]MBU4431662.1 hydrogenase formation protein HypD [Patescibacteria group bacterium]MBU4577898.1 hydrogenase formation protein HypD [Patescibacteria group bacterium]MCG2696592.1 hydrogenase formation protein HypD [Candidatus Parcubacteria bacterium]
MLNTKNIIENINLFAQSISKDVNLMEVCGTHTQAISRYGIRQLMPANINLITGPGCPVCVTDQSDIDNLVNLALAGIPIATYGDTIKVPGDFGSLEDAQRKGAKIFAVYSIEEALELKKEYPDLVFFGLGFETTAPMTAYAIKNGLTVYSAHKLFLPAMIHLLKNGLTNIDGFINPGHVSVIVGTEAYKKIKAPQVITGFEAEDVLVGIHLLLKQINEKRQDVENEYTRAVTKTGNTKAYDLIFEVFEPSNGLWRGLGNIPNSGLVIKKKYQAQDAKIKYQTILNKIKHTYKKNAACKCGHIIQGALKPQQCPMFNTVCTPDKPFGPCMVSSEGACNIEYQNN